MYLLRITKISAKEPPGFPIRVEHAVRLQDLESAFALPVTIPQGYGYVAPMRRLCIIQVVVHGLI